MVTPIWQKEKTHENMESTDGIEYRDSLVLLIFLNKRKRLGVQSTLLKRLKPNNFYFSKKKLNKLKVV